MKSIGYYMERRKLKRERRNVKWADPYKIDDMSDDYLISNKNKIIAKSVVRIIFGLLIILGVILILVLLWSTIFYSPGRWLF